MGARPRNPPGQSWGWEHRGWREPSTPTLGLGVGWEMGQGPRGQGVALPYTTGDKAPCPKPPSSLPELCSGLPASSKPFSPRKGAQRSRCRTGVMLNRPLQGTEVLGSPALQCDGEPAELRWRCHRAFISTAISCELVLAPLGNAGWVVLFLGLAFLHRAGICSPSQSASGVPQPARGLEAGCHPSSLQEGRAVR